LNDGLGCVRGLVVVGLRRGYLRGDHLLLIRAFEIARLGRLGTKVLNRFHHVVGLRVVRVTEGLGPGNVRVHLGDQRGNLRHFLDALIPRLAVHFGNIIRVFH
jgi:hypothetical protein